MKDGGKPPNGSTHHESPTNEKRSLKYPCDACAPNHFVSKEQVDCFENPEGVRHGKQLWRV